MTLPLPSNAPLSQKAARAFHHAASHLLAHTGRGRGFQNEVATTVGTINQSYNDALRGRSATIDRIHRWLAAWNQVEGLPQLRMILDTDDVTIRVVGRPLAFGPLGQCAVPETLCDDPVPASVDRI